MIAVRFYAAARDAAGRSECQVDAADTTSLQAALADRFGEPMARVLAVSSLVSAGTRLSPDDPLPPDATVDVLPPFAGG